ncbi:PilZ domain-containing protein [Pseudomonas fluorescens]|uniref:Cyclic diguanosine monophosphate-binding protein n=1 Tax=Pseudomonas lactucae TaxID=2813360 RepID=A0A9X0YFF8_9PSED|nr:PilZ domain-containing protein [Pseudomonas lactucae]OPA84360.1 PilZ domain-containing protein [Pseudomonas fluorescens]MBN2978375.1 PilZ domain-containing protein [Pseudomonas lactucae]MBN2987450.1 PilZ domain-containing protein [Pseudomonas lactucae]OPA84933.1 PilZ domain-containing protein [Pseudomonas fluorescens]OPB05066.1 PilZ domain-containing protein [Pseudomonas fluorescens]
MTEHAPDRRRFRRIAFDAKTEIRQNGHEWPVQLVDLSLKGLLVQRPDAWKGNKALPFSIDIRLDPKTHIKMQVRLTHEEHEQLGFVCKDIDLDSISHLRRLIEFNLGDQEELERELGALLEV